MKTDAQLQKDVMDQLKWEPFLKASEIGVSAHNGVVTLSGQVDSFARKLAAEKAAQKVQGVKAIAEDIAIQLPTAHVKTDTEIAEAVLNALRWHSGVEDEKVKIKVENGIVKLAGEVEWEFQRSNAKTAIVHLTGVKAVINLIKVSPKASPADVQQKIANAFHRHATIDARNISVTMSGNRAILQGTVRSFAEKEDAENAAWAAPGVTNVENLLEIRVP